MASGGTLMVVTDNALVRAGSLEELRQKGCLVVSAAGHTMAVFWHEDRAWAVDNRCPHMGFPLSRGTVCDGILTCHWHHARFDLATGGTFDPFADDVAVHDVRVVDGVVWVDPRPRAQGGRAERYLARLQDALPTDASAPARLRGWCRQFVEVRNGDGAERVLLTAIAAGMPAADVCEMVQAAATDHFFINGGHTVDFVNKGFELLATIGWQHAADVLPSLVRGLAGA